MFTKFGDILYLRTSVASQVQYIPKLCKHSWDPNHVRSKLTTCFKEGLMMTL